MGREAQRFVDMRVKLADHADERVTCHHTCRTARMPLRGYVLSLRLVQRELCANAVGNTLHGFNCVGPVHGTAIAHPAGVDGVAGQNAGDVHRLVRQTCVKRGQLLAGRLDGTRQCRNGRSVRIPQVDVSDFVQ